MIDILFVLLLILLIYRIRVIKPRHVLNRQEYLSVKTGKYYRGFFAVVVIFHHLALRTESGIAFRYFTTVGFLAVSFFFFVSGYGLQKSYITKSEQYRKGFLQKRIPAILIPYLFITFLYWLINLTEGVSYSLNDIFVSIINGDPIASNSWYIINILLFYIAFWLIMLICNNQHTIMIYLGIIWYVFYILLCIKMEYGDWWYKSTPLLIIGMCWAVYEDKILAVLNKSFAVIAPVIIISFLVFYLIYLYYGKIDFLRNIPYFSTVVAFPTAILFSLSIVMFSLKVQIGNRILGFLGEMSLELYLSQGLFITLLRGSHVYIENELLWCSAVLIGTIAFSYLLHLFFRFFLRLIQRSIAP